LSVPGLQRSASAEHQKGREVVMFRSAFAAFLIGLLASAPVLADSRGKQSAAPGSGSGKRIAWTIVGAAAGFGAGLFLGLNQFDDAIDSDRKVWTTALVGAAAGGIAGGLLSRNVGRAPRVTAALGLPRQSETPRVSWSIALGRSAVAPDASPARPSGLAALFPDVVQ
jgi:hypothetical protein